MPPFISVDMETRRKVDPRYGTFDIQHEMLVVKKKIVPNVRFVRQGFYVHPTIFSKTDTVCYFYPKTLSENK